MAEVELFLEAEKSNLQAKKRQPPSSTEKLLVNGSPENGKSPPGLANGVSGVAGDEDSSTCAGASVQVKSNGTIVFKKVAASNQ